jgi:N-methylhydantoinase A
MASLLAADTGGTFTDLAAFDRDTGRIVYSKSLTTYDNLVNGVMDCIAKAGVNLSDVELVKFGTTLVINTFVQRNGAKTALITTEGHRDILELRRGNRTVPFDRRYERDPVLIERDLRLEAPERMGADGEVVRPLDVERVRLLAAQLKESDVEAVAVSFLNAYVNPAHEERVTALLRELLPNMYVVAGSELTREWYEYERTSTAAANAYVGPKLRDYVQRLDRRLRDGGLERPFMLMASNGGVIAVDRAQQQPGVLVESGPVGGCIGAVAYARELGFENLIAFDMGGTTAKCALIDHGEFEVKSPYYVGGEQHGFPVRHAVLDIVEVGAGGGSIAWLDPQGRLRVGPRSAGSSPGPACYGRGGEEPTITDANLVLGRIGASSFLGGEMQLDEDAARAAVARLGESLGFTGETGIDETAEGIIALGAVTMAAAIRRITVERGLDPREFAMFAFGGGGPLHASTLAHELHIPEVIVPPEPGIFSALGMLLADARIDETRTLLRPLDAAALPDIEQAYVEMEHTITESLQRELEVGGAEIVVQRSAQLRFHGQRHFVRTPLPAGADLAAMRNAFEMLYRQRYGFVEVDAPVDVVSVSVTAVARLSGPLPTQLRPALPTATPAASTRRAISFPGHAERVDTPVYRRIELPVGFAAPGPAAIEEYGTTTIVAPGDQFRIGELGEIRILIAAEETEPWA